MTPIDTISETAISGYTLISVRVLSRYRGRYCDIISRSVLNLFVWSGVSSRDQQNELDDDDDDELNGNREMYADEMRMHRVGQVRSQCRHGLVTTGAAQAGVGHCNLSWSLFTVQLGRCCHPGAPAYGAAGGPGLACQIDKSYQMSCLISYPMSYLIYYPILQ